ncbi:MAG: hypothetical protein JXA10_01390, partial [Anaerolineae bacterium]|nr:hypothetical protein [Anaerolineae bacterium]
MASSSTTQNGDVISLQETEEIYRSQSLWQKAIKRILHDRLTLTALSVLFGLAALCFSAPLVERILDIEYNHNDLYNSRLPMAAHVADSNTTTLMWDGETGEHVRSP